MVAGGVGWGARGWKINLTPSWVFPKVVCNSSSEFDFAFILDIYNKCLEDVIKILFIKQFLYPELQRFFQKVRFWRNK